MDKLRLSPRLAAVARLAEGGRNIVDVGTDHGFLPVHFALSGAAGLLMATDVRERPLERAKLTAREYGVWDHIRFVLCDGLDFEGASSVDTVVMAGMGGETMTAILERAPWTKSGVTLVLQPQSKLNELCLWLGANGFAVKNAVLAGEAGRLYVAMTVSGGAAGSLYCEDILLKNRDPLLPFWLEKQLGKLHKAAAGASKARAEQGTGALALETERLLRIKEETDKWPR